jgi:hypothetical protein
MYAMWQLPESMKQSQADLYLETYQVLDLEMSRLREIQQWQASASSKVCDFLPSFPFFPYCLQYYTLCGFKLTLYFHNVAILFADVASS